MHLCTVCLAETDSYVVCRYVGYLFGFSICRDILCVHEFQMELKPTVLMMGFVLWE